MVLSLIRLIKENNQIKDLESFCVKVKVQTLASSLSFHFFFFSFPFFFFFFFFFAFLKFFDLLVLV